MNPVRAIAAALLLASITAKTEVQAQETGGAATRPLVPAGDGVGQRGPNFWEQVEHSPFHFSLAIGVDGAYDSNVFNGRGPDWVTRLTPHVALGYVDRRVDIRLSYDLGLWNYLRGTARSSLNHRGRLGFQARATRRFTIHVQEELVRADDPGFLLRAGVIAPQTGIFDNILEVGGSYRLARRLDLGLGYLFRLTAFDRQPAGLPPLHDGDEHDGLASLSFRVTRLDDLRLAYRFQYYTADDNSLARTHTPTLGWRHQFLRELELRIEAGPVRYDGLSVASSSGWTWVGQGALRWATPSWRLSLNYVHDLIGGTGAASVLWADYGYARLAYRTPGGLFDVHANVGAFQNGYAPAQARLYYGVTVEIGADVRLWASLRLGGYYMFLWQEATAATGAAGPLLPVNRHIVGLRLFAVIGDEARPPRREVRP